MEPPRKPGRPKIHDTPADRVRAHRARAAEKALASGAGAGVEATADRADVATPELAVASLATVLPALGAQFGQIAALVQRVESAIGTVSDPTALDRRLELMRAETARAVSAAEERVAAAETAAHAATVRADALDSENDDLRADAAQAWERTAAAEESAAAALARLDDQASAHQHTVDELDARHRRDLGTLQDNHETVVATLNTTHHETVERYDDQVRRLEHDLAELRTESKALRADLTAERAAHQDDNRTHATTLDRQRTDATKRESELRRDLTERIEDQKTIAADLREEIAIQRGELDRLRGLEEDLRHN